MALKKKKSSIRDRAGKAKSFDQRLDSLKNLSRKDKRRIGAIILGLFIVLFIQMAEAGGKSEQSAQIVVSPTSIEIKQDEQIPKLTVSATCTEKQQKVVLDKAEDYTVKNLLEDLEKGEGCELSCEADGKSEGEFKIELKMDEAIRSKLENQWEGKVFITATDGTLTVKNKDGEWNRKKFQKYDGTYAKNEFVTSMNQKYYCGDDGTYVTGWQEIQNEKYHFSDDGVMDADKFLDVKGGKCYFKENGAMATGWCKKGDDLYYFEENGVMVTGEKQIGSSKCVFSEKGKLKSRESNIDPNKPMMALTFDDGPGERTSELLEVLEENGAHATFFMQGIHVSDYADDVKKMKEIGCELGNHSYDHPQLTTLGDGGASQIAQTNQLIQQACGSSATVMRPPYGAIDDNVSASVGMPMILWNIDTLDWSTLDAASTINVVLTEADDGDIVLMHDIHSTSIDAAIELIPQLIQNGYQLVTVSELAEARGIIMENGVSYTDFNKPGEENEY